jgi:ABC-type glutathione transport system ATPase component
MGLSAIVVTHDLAVVRLLADRLMVMKDGHVIETGLTDQVLDDPQPPTRSFWSAPCCRCEEDRHDRRRKPLQILHAAQPGRRGHSGAGRRGLFRGAGRMRGADRRKRGGQVDRDAHPLRQLPGRGGIRGADRRAGPDHRRAARDPALRRETLGYVSQFLRVVPRVPTLDVVAEPLLALGVPRTRPARAPKPCWSGCASPRRSGRCRPPPFRAANSSA